MNNIINHAKTLFRETIKLFSNPNSASLDSLPFNTSIWNLPITNEPMAHNSFTFIDLVRGIIPINLSSAVKGQGLSPAQVSLVFKTLVEYVQASCWTLIWIPRCDAFATFLRNNNVTPEQKRFAKPSGLPAVSLSPTRKPHLSFPDSLLASSKSLVDDYISYGIGFPFPSGNNLVTWIFSLFW
jgi:hypothetical protein